MYAFKIQGGQQLKGEVEINGAKNAILPIMIAALLTKEPLSLSNISYLSDVNTLSELLKSMGMKIKTKKSSIILTADKITNFHADYNFVSKMRASFWVLGPLLARFGEAEVSLPGGCAIGTRPVDLYLNALKEMGAEIKVENGYVCAKGPLHGANIFFPKVSVGATHNTIMAAVLTKGITTIHNPALEPEVMDLIDVLVKMGAKISGIGTKVLTIEGVDELHGASHEVVADRIEAATFAVAAAVTKGKIFLKGAKINLMDAVVDALRPSNVLFKEDKNGILVDATKCSLKATSLTTSEYPGFPTDAQAPLSMLLSLAPGMSLIEERIFENRFMHIPELKRMGANITVLNNNAILITGVKNLSGAQVMSSDLRGGVSLVLAALAAKGESIVKRIYHIDRGYYQLEKKLTKLGAKIKRIKSKN
ncbi:MAG: UDP-N-acetylglucosamine 1-carboxyvinyltransferase [Alphaproteobacteria bacterium]|nr:UDP-N-acetylglucosamine 1-carboxyvinyltransferase [Alphaproteobacteria bacterium]